jgi:uncharacterized protein
MPQTSSMLWRRLDQPGHESSRLSYTQDGSLLTGAAVFGHERQACRLDYAVECDEEWHTLSASVAGWLGDTTIAVKIVADSQRRWTLNGTDCPQVTGCRDVDLSFSPSTNLLPIRRLSLRVGERANVRAAWLRFPTFSLEPLDQEYERVGDSSYRYESAGGAFVAALEVNSVGFVTNYPDLWKQEWAG